MRLLQLFTLVTAALCGWITVEIALDGETWLALYGATVVGFSIGCAFCLPMIARRGGL